MKTLLLSCALLAGGFSFSQVAINSTGAAPDGSAMLDVKSTNQGLLVPRMTAAERGAIGSPATGLLVYQTDGSTGFYYNTGTPAVPNWVSLPSSLTAGWSIAGNAGTNPTLNFIGTTDNTPLRFVMNNNHAGMIGTNNTAFGSSSLPLASTGAHNTAFGASALGAGTSGSFNLAAGSGAMLASGSGFYNVAVGFSSLAINTGNANVGIGPYALVNNGNGSDNVAIGSNALYNNATGKSNVAIGKMALYMNPSYSNTVAIGDSALYANGSYNDGSTSLESLHNTAVGSKSLYSNSDGYNNTALGFEAGYKMSRGWNNTVLGANAMRNGGGFGAEGNVAVGVNALDSNTGIHNTAIGYYALQRNKFVGGNVAVGHMSLQSNTTGSNNTAVGKSSGGGNSTGPDNTAVGAFSGGSTTGSFNTAVGSGAGSSIVSSYTTTLGAGAKVDGQWNIDYSTAIGAKAYVMAPHSIVLGAIAGTNGATVSAKVGIGTSGPRGYLHVAGYSTSGAEPHQLIEEKSTGYTRLAFKNFTTANMWTIGGLPQATSANAKMTFYWDGLGADVLSLFGNGNGTFLGACTAAGFYTFSDQNLKRNITPLAASLASLQGINGYTYYWKDEKRGTTQQLGLLAQEVQKAYPQLVQADEKGVLTVNYQGLVPVLVNAVKEQQQTIEEQQTRLDEQRRLLTELERRLAALEQKEK